MKKVFSIGFVLVTTVFLICIATNGVYKVLNRHPEATLNEAVWSDKDEYPFMDGTTNDEQSEADSNTTASSSIESLFSTIKFHIENNATVSNPFYQKSIFLMKRIDKILGKNATTSLNGTNNDCNDPHDLVFDLSDNYFAYIMDDTDISVPLNAMVDFTDEAKSKDINVLYLSVPLEIGEDSKEMYQKYASVYPDYIEEKEQQIFDTLKAHDIPIVTLDSVCPDIHTNTRSYFFKTDHHWLPQTGLKACSALSDSLNRLCGYHIDLHQFDLENYTISRNFPSLGSEGKKVTHIYAKPETVPILTPNYETDLSVSIYDYSDITHQRGTLEDTLLIYSTGEIEDLYSHDTYDVYTGGRGRIRIHNNKIHDGTHLLLIKLSQANCMIPYLSTQVEYLDAIDLRRFNGSLRTFIEKEKPDTIAFIYGTRAFAAYNDPLYIKAFQFK